AVRAHEPVLHGVLGQPRVAPAARCRVADEPRPVARDELAESGLVAAGGGEQEGVVGALLHPGWDEARRAEVALAVRSGHARSTNAPRPEHERAAPRARTR